jgi:hypothetical protein
MLADTGVIAYTLFYVGKINDKPACMLRTVYRQRKMLR